MNAMQEFELSEVEKDIIRKHMFPLTLIPPRYRETWIVCLVDKICSVKETLHYSQWNVWIVCQHKIGTEYGKRGESD